MNRRFFLKCIAALGVVLPSAGTAAALATVGAPIVLPRLRGIPNKSRYCIRAGERGTFVRSLKIRPPRESVDSAILRCWMGVPIGDVLTLVYECVVCPGWPSSADVSTILPPGFYMVVECDNPEVFMCHVAFDY
jgi:hypothetical protein